MKNKLIALFTILFFSSYIVKAEEPPDYEHLLSGECVSQNGFFFTENGMIKLITGTEEKLKLVGLDKQKEIDLLKIDLDGCTKSKKLELQIQKDMFEEQLKIKQKVIDGYANETFWTNIKIVSAFVIGAGIGFAVFKIASP